MTDLMHRTDHADLRRRYAEAEEALRFAPARDVPHLTAYQVGELLGVVAIVDRYAPRVNRCADQCGVCAPCRQGEALIATWREMLAGVPFQFAQDSVKAHYRSTTDSIAPGDILRAWRAAKRRRQDARITAAARERAAVDRRDQLLRNTEGVAKVRAALALAKKTKAQGRPLTEDEQDEVAETAAAEAEARRLWLTVRCPYCRAAEGRPCVVRGRRERELSVPHPARAAVAAGASEQDALAPPRPGPDPYAALPAPTSWTPPVDVGAAAQWAAAGRVVGVLAPTPAPDPTPTLDPPRKTPPPTRGATRGGPTPTREDDRAPRPAADLITEALTNPPPPPRRRAAPPAPTLDPDPFDDDDIPF